MKLKNPDLDLIRSMLLECGYFGFMIRFWISPKKRKIRVWIQESVFGFSHKNTPLIKYTMPREVVFIVYRKLDFHSQNYCLRL